MAETLDRLRSWLEAEHEGPLMAAVLDALDGEITRWEGRSRTDPEARPVLRAFLGVREILWEITARGGGPAPSPEPGGEEAAGEEPAPRRTRSRRSTRARRVRVEG